MCNEHLKSFHKSDGNKSENQVAWTGKEMTDNSELRWTPEIRSIESVLVHTGVSLQDGENSANINMEGARFRHRDTVFQPHLRRACHVVDDITAAVELILKKEQDCS